MTLLSESGDRCNTHANEIAFTPIFLGRKGPSQSHVVQHGSFCGHSTSVKRYCLGKSRRPTPRLCNAGIAKIDVVPVSLTASERNEVEIIALTDDWVAVNKPAGVLVHRTKLYHATPGESYLVDDVKRAVAGMLGSPTSVLPVQRLDRPTSGVIVFALGDSKNASQLQNALQSEESQKEYWTITFGADMPEKWENHHPLRDLTGKSRKQRPASSAFEQLLKLNESDMSVVRAQISTGRRHQIRRHLSNSRHPVVGDTSHGKGSLNRRVREQFGVTRCCLHSRRVAFIDPGSLNPVSLEAVVPQDLRDVLDRLPDYDDAHDALLDLGTINNRVT